MDEIINSDVTKDIIESLRRSTQAMKGGIMPVGGIDGIQETMDELQAELQASQEVTDTIYKGLDGVGGSGFNDDDESTLVDELNSLLRDTGEDEIDLPVLDKLLPSVPSTITKRSNGGGAVAEQPVEDQPSPLLI